MRPFTRVAIALAMATTCARVAGATAAVTATPGKFANVNGIRMYYETHGRGPALLLLHGGAGNGMQFDHQVPALEKTHRLIVPDARAQGRTSVGSGPLTYHRMAEDVVALMDRLHVARADVMGWSDGGVIGLDLAIHHPKRIRRLVTLGANFSPDGMNPADAAWAATATADSFGPGMKEGWTKLSPEPARYDEVMTMILNLWRTEPNFTPAQLAHIHSPTLVIAGEHDVVRPEHTEALAKAIPGATLWIVPGASHSVMIEQPDQVNARVLEFLGK